MEKRKLYQDMKLDYDKDVYEVYDKYEYRATVKVKRGTPRNDVEKIASGMMHGIETYSIKYIATI